jgi:hypothetical protein
MLGSSDFCTLYAPPYVSTSTKNVRGGQILNFPQKQKFAKKPKKNPKTASSAAFATSTAYLASLVCLIVLKNKAKKGKNKS